MIADIVIILLVAYLLYEAYTLRGKISNLKQNFGNFEAINGAMWSMIQAYERKGNKGEAKRAKSGNIKVVNPTGKGSKRKGLQR